ncbi:MAG TPA: hypothetical protein VJJ22_03330 [Candidatus Paceibacterota bacterium]
MQKRNIILALIIIAILAFLLIRNKAVAPGDEFDLGNMTVATTSTQVSTSTDTELVEQTVGGVTFTALKGSGVTIEQVSDAPAPPKLYVPTSFPGSTNPDVQAVIVANVKELNAKLTANPQDFNSWLTLGTTLKIAGDNTGAVTIWLYLTKAFPDAYEPYANLADMYVYTLKDYKLAETYLDLAISKAKNNISLYRNSYEFYRRVKGDDVKAKAVLQAGITANPGKAGDLEYLLAHYNEL